MKTHLHLLFYVLVCYSCSHHSMNSQERCLLSVDTLIHRAYYDSAMAILYSISIDSLSSMEMKAKYALRLTQINDKKYVKHKNDSLMRMAAEFYDKTTDMQERAKVHYYLGRVLQDEKNAIGAVQEFVKALPLAVKARNYELQCLLQANLGYIFYTHGLLQEADSLYQQSAELADKCGDSLRWAACLVKRADICMKKGEAFYCQAETELLKIQLTKFTNNLPLKRQVALSFASLYEYMNRPEEALNFSRQYMSLQPDTIKYYGVYSVIGSAFFKEEKYDSAIYYLNKALLSTSCLTKAGAYMRLSDIAKAQGRSSDALEYEDAYTFYKSVADSTKYPVKIIMALKDALHNQVVSLYESFLIRYRFSLLFLLLIVLILSVYVLCVRLRNRKKLSKVELEQLRQNQINYCLRGLLEEEKKEATSLRQLLVQKDEVIKQLNIVRHQQLLNDTPIYNKLLFVKERNAEKVHEFITLTKEEWDDLVLEVNRISANSITKLADSYERLTEEDFRFCALLKLGLSFSDIALIWGCTTDAVYKREKSILRRMGIDRKIKLKAMLVE